MKTDKGDTMPSWHSPTHDNLMVNYLMLLHHKGEALAAGPQTVDSLVSLSHSGMITSYWGAMQHLLDHLAEAQAQAEAKAARRTIKIITPT